MLSQLREPFARISRPIIVFFAKLGIHPTVFTITGLLLSISAGIFIAANNFLAALILIFFGAAMDYIDGGVARYRNLASKQGLFLDSISDRISDFALFGGMILNDKVDIYTGIIMLASALLISYIRAKGESVGIKKMAIGVMERAERLLFLVLLLTLSLLIPSFNEPFFGYGSFVYGCYFTIGYMILTALSVITVFQRIIYASLKLNETETASKA